MKKLAGPWKKHIGHWPVQINGKKFATGQILKKPVEVVFKGADFSWLSSKVSRTLACLVYIKVRVNVKNRGQIPPIMDLGKGS